MNASCWNILLANWNVYSLQCIHPVGDLSVYGDEGSDCGLGYGAGFVGGGCSTVFSLWLLNKYFRSGVNIQPHV